MLNISSNRASTNVILTVQHLMVQVRTFEAMARDDDASLMDCGYCMDAPSHLPAGYTAPATSDWIRR